MLGVILFEAKCIVLLDSLHDGLESKTKQIQGLFCDLFTLARLTYLAANRDTSIGKWMFVYGNDFPLQKDGTECGVIVCLGVLSILNRVNYASSSSISAFNHLRNRRWVFEVLSRFHNSYTEPEKPVKKSIAAKKASEISDKIKRDENKFIPIKIQDSLTILNTFLSKKC